MLPGGDDVEQKVTPLGRFLVGRVFDIFSAFGLTVPHHQLIKGGTHKSFPINRVIKSEV